MDSVSSDESSTSASLKSRFKFIAVSILFLLSGLSSLIYQVIWTRMLVFVFGSTTFATSTVLAVFMGGLALGSYVAGRYADKVKNPFLWYGILEGIIGLWAVLAPVLFAAAIPLYKLFFDALHLNLVAFGLVRFAVAALILLIPTACMGATLPLLSKFITENLEEVGDRVGTLYAINTLGAVIGSLIGGFVLLPTLGIKMTTYIAALTNECLAGGVFLLSKMPEFKLVAPTGTAASEPAADTSAAQNESAKLPPVVLATLISIAISGGLAMTYEVAWTRSLLMVIGSTTYAFTVMLSTFLIGIFLGSLICARIVDRLKAPIIWFGLAEMTLCLAGFFSIFLFNYLPYFNVVVGSLYGQSPDICMLFRFIGAAIVLIPISLCLGFIFPLAVKVCARDLLNLGRSVGQVYAVNTVGAIIGAFISGFLVIPNLGSELSLVACCVCSLLLGIGLLIGFGNIKGSIKVLCGVAACMVVIWAAQAPHFWDHRIMVFAQTQRRNLLATNQLGTGQFPSLSEWEEKTKDWGEVTFYKEGKTANVVMIKNKGKVVLFTNGHPDASDSGDMENQVTVSAYPLLVYPGAKDICVVGWGSGVSNGYALQFPIKSMVCSEIEAVVIETSRFFHHVNFKAEQDKRAIMEPSDGRNYLLGTSQKFDAIISEPSNPWQSGVCNLFTQEYFKICRDNLAKGGVFTFWTQIGEIPPKNLGEVFSALHSVFPCVYVMSTGIGDVNCIAFPEQRKIKYDDLKKSFAVEKVKSALSRFNLTTPEDFIARIMVAPDGVEKATKGVPPNSDDINKLEYEVSKTYENRQFRYQILGWLNDNCGNIWDSIDWGTMTDEQKSVSFFEIARACAGRDGNYAMRWCNESIKLHPNADAMDLIAEVLLAQKKYAEALKVLNEGQKLYPKEERFFGLAGLVALKQADYAKAIPLFEKALQINKSNYDFHYYLAQCFSGLDLEELDVPYVPPAKLDPARVVELCSFASQNPKFVASRPNVLVLLAEGYKDVGKYAEASNLIKGILRESPTKFQAWKTLAEIYAGEKQWDRSSFCWNQYFDLTSRNLNSFIARTRRIMDQGNDVEALRRLQYLNKLAPANADLQGMLKELSGRNPAAKKFYDSVNMEPEIFESPQTQPQAKSSAGL